MLLRNQTAIVTGASRGIGRAIALTLAQEGACLIINGTNEELLAEVAASINIQGGRCLIQLGDVSCPETAATLAAYTVSQYGKIDILVNNAGINMRTATLQMTWQDWQKVLDVNLNGTLYCCKAVLPHMIQAGCGKIVNVSSTTAKTPHRNAAPSYGASKAAVNYLTQHLSLEMAKYGVYVNAVCPGPTETDMTNSWSAEYRRQVLEKVPLGKLGTAQNIADGVLFLASKMSDFITGETLNINGGTYMN